MTEEIRLAIVPREGLFFKDGRGWHTSASGRAGGLSWPLPTTIYGAIRAAWGRLLEQEKNILLDKQSWQNETKEARLDCLLPLRREFGASWKAEHRMWPFPADALYVEGREKILRLEPEKPKTPTIGLDNNPAREGLWRPCLDDDQTKPESAPEWWTDKEFICWLSGNSIPKHSEEQKNSFRLHTMMQAHVRINPETFTHLQGALFSIEQLEMLSKNSDGVFEWAMAVKAHLPGGTRKLSGEIFTLGADRRLALAENIEEKIFSVPQKLLEAFGKQGCNGLRLVVVTPAYFKNGWLPDNFQANGNNEYRGSLPELGEVILRAAFVPRPVHASGWDMANHCPKKTLRLVPKGAVYFFEKSGGANFTKEEASQLWLAKLGENQEQGLGSVVPGIWPHLWQEFG